MLKFFNNLTHKLQIFKPLKDKKVGLYTCGPTVYSYAHIGNLRTYIFEDVLKRVLRYNNYKVKHVMNITDVGHLTSQADSGEDKIELAAKKEGQNAWQIAKFYTEAFKKDIQALNILEPDIWVKATDTIKDQIKLIQILEKKGYIYRITDGIYFDTSKLKNYGRLWPKKLKKKIKEIDLEKYARIEKIEGKKNLTDFALWKFTPLGVKRQMEWDSPWGRGFPGWHTECVVMASKFLGIPFDIHCGGIDHILIHHTNEIAQAEAAYGKILANYWLHGEFLILDKGKMSKSEGNFITLNDLIAKNFNPLAYRYFCFTTHYRQKLTFSWEGLAAAQAALNRLYEKVKEFKKQVSKTQLNLGQKAKKYQKKFNYFISEDLKIPQALALMWQMIKDKNISASEKYYLLLDFDKVLGLKLAELKEEKIPSKILKLVNEREMYRQQKNYQKADELREKIKNLGYLIEDTPSGPVVRKR
ncbi:MAG: cysteine--tRNA ligase [Patescibacteria group bacterium]|nr:cysteine--tRNA ligase [Patescibacteria group bacterium]